MLTLLISFILVASTIAIHYESLRFTSKRLTHLKIAPRSRIVVILTAALASHLVHALLYALAFLLLEPIGGFGTIGGERGHDLEDAFYFSITSYTTLGIGDLYPTGALRIISGIEALSGLVMVGWTASMTYIYMEKFWNIKNR
ncbi:potassium channel family protein [Aurantiacibacter poecillastricola]|uniref:potassium channel family protein n=1 Tax=Aurantiacibacter poecillastricola TaxID=3064385 RepID=UPI00273FC288|nr:potassium channel family protein [Aurantiacibacter sp. 219JJ12-13]MDP5262408.1 potassium channel family protein [Aurantiacibacter sp. 219JJ12-13]